MDPSGMKKYTEEDEDGAAGASAAAATAAAKVTIGKLIFFNEIFFEKDLDDF